MNVRKNKASFKGVMKSAACNRSGKLQWSTKTTSLFYWSRLTALYFFLVNIDQIEKNQIEIFEELKKSLTTTKRIPKSKILKKKKKQFFQNFKLQIFYLVDVNSPRRLTAPFQPVHVDELHFSSRSTLLTLFNIQI